MTIDSRQASEALNEIDAVIRAVRQSTIYQTASLMMIWWGPLTAVGYIVTYLWPRYAGPTWLAIYAVGVAGMFAIGALLRVRTGARGFDYRTLMACLLFIGFGFMWTTWLTHFTPRQHSAFWPMYYMLTYSIVGLWFGWAFVAIGLGISALTLIGYFYAGMSFDLWMALVNGGGLILSGLWMRRT